MCFASKSDSSQVFLAVQTVQCSKKGASEGRGLHSTSRFVQVRMRFPSGGLRGIKSPGKKFHTLLVMSFDSRSFGRCARREVTGGPSILSGRATAAAGWNWEGAEIGRAHV